jgi:hypothetical protein
MTLAKMPIPGPMGLATDITDSPIPFGQVSDFDTILGAAWDCLDTRGNNDPKT